MRRLVYLGLIVALVPWLVIGVVNAFGEEDRDDGYFVRAIFDSASSLVEGEDVKVAGAVVGRVAELNVTEENKAAVTLEITDEDFTPWRGDAGCTIRPQSLIGEKFVECEAGTTSAQPLERIDSGDGEGERLLPVEQNSAPVDLDLLNNVLRLPYRQRLSILLAELGTGFAGRGEELNEVIHRANPALRETDKVLKILAQQNRELVRLARDSDTALADIARERKSVSGFIEQANATGEASAERRVDISRGIERLPAFLRELRPLMADLDSLALEGTPVLRDLGEAAPQMGRLIKGLGTFSEASSESFPSLGDALETGRSALIRSAPLFEDLARLGRQLKPVAGDLDKLTASLRKTGAIERINDFVYYLALATNGFDSVGHYLRAGLITQCPTYEIEGPKSQCRATFFNPLEGGSSSSLAERNAPARRGGGASVAPQGGLLQGLIGTPETKAQTLQREQAMERLRKRAKAPSPALDGADPMIEYLLGGDG